MKEDNKKVQNILDKYAEYNKSTFRIKTESETLEFHFGNDTICHLLGMHYLATGKKGLELYKYVKDSDFNDREILETIKDNHSIITSLKIQNRIETFDEFMENIEKATLYHSTNKNSNINAKYIMLQLKDNQHLQLMLGENNKGIKIVEYDTWVKPKNFTKTYIVENDDRYYSKSELKEKVLEFSRYDKKERKFIPFSFNKDKDRRLKTEYYKKEKSKLEKKDRKGMER